MEVLLIIPFLLGYLVTMYLINKKKTIELVKHLMKYAQIYLEKGDLKKQFVTETAKEIIESKVPKAPLSKVVDKVISNQVENIVESNVAEIKSTPIDLGAMNNANLLVDKVMESDSKGLISVYGKVVGDNEKKINYEVGVNYIKKL